ncbi:hypothetical protein [Piscinibacter sp.]|uniref:hypothetical protein n=1 Tax=Piscinibacter sp. TaxID=1903157 RepID=UPI0039E36AFE
MNARHALMTALSALALAAPATTVFAQAAAPVATPNAAEGEPRVQHIVHEDNATRIEELRARGATQRITVTPKLGTTRGYEILTGDGSRDLGEGVNTSRGAAGKRVWSVLSF